jgi:predicted NodU family carbamoyl transferase
MGAWFKNTLCITSGEHAYISKTVGDLDTPDACRAHEQTARALLAMLGEKPHAIAHDLHPDFHSSRFAAQLAAELEVPLIAVQHHHAHIAALCAEHRVDEPVLGLALDGAGWVATAAPGAANCCAWTVRRSSVWDTCARCRCRAATVPRASLGAWPQQCCMNWGVATKSPPVFPHNRLW